MVERIQPVGPSNLLNNMVQVFANTRNTSQPSNLRTPFGARHESTALCRWGVLNPKKIETMTHGRGARGHFASLQSSEAKQCTVSCSYDHMPVSQGYMRAQYPLLNGPMGQHVSWLEQNLQKKTQKVPICSTFMGLGEWVADYHCQWQ